MRVTKNRVYETIELLQTMANERNLYTLTYNGVLYSELALYIANDTVQLVCKDTSHGGTSVVSPARGYREIYFTLHGMILALKAIPTVKN